MNQVGDRSQMGACVAGGADRSRGSQKEQERSVSGASEDENTKPRR